VGPQDVRGWDLDNRPTMSPRAHPFSIVGICVGTDDDVMGLLTGGLLGGLHAGSVVVNHWTGTPGNAREFTDAGKDAGVEVLDAPVSGGRPAAQERRLITMVGGPKAFVDRCRPVFETFARDVVHLAPLPGRPRTQQMSFEVVREDHIDPRRQ